MKNKNPLEVLLTNYCASCSDKLNEKNLDKNMMISDYGDKKELPVCKSCADEFRVKFFNKKNESSK